jgi:hypothetical protein
LNGYANFENIEKVVELYDQAKRAGLLLPPNVRLCVMQCLLNAPRQGLPPELFEKIVQSLRQHDLNDKIVHLYDAMQNYMAQFTQGASDCVISALLRLKIEFTSISRLSPSLSSLIQILKMGSKRTIGSVNFLEKILDVPTAPTTNDFFELLTLLSSVTNFETFWPTFRHFVKVGADVSAPIIDLASRYLEQLESYDDMSFLLNTVHDSGIPVSKELLSAALLLALSSGNLGDALSLHEEIDAAQWKASEEAERQYTQVFSQLQDMLPAEPGVRRTSRTRARSRTFPRTDLVRWQAHRT